MHVLMTTAQSIAGLKFHMRDMPMSSQANKQLSFSEWEKYFSHDVLICRSAFPSWVGDQPRESVGVLCFLFRVDHRFCWPLQHSAGQSTTKTNAHVLPTAPDSASAAFAKAIVPEAAFLSPSRSGDVETRIVEATVRKAASPSKQTRSRQPCCPPTPAAEMCHALPGTTQKSRFPWILLQTQLSCNCLGASLGKRAAQKRPALILPCAFAGLATHSRAVHEGLGTHTCACANIFV